VELPEGDRPHVGGIIVSLTLQESCRQIVALALKNKLPTIGSSSTPVASWPAGRITPICFAGRPRTSTRS